MMLSRIADSLFWMARYMERAEDTARILDVNYHMMIEESPHALRMRWDPLVAITGEQERFAAQCSQATPRNVFEFLAFSADNPSSIVQCITSVRENARTIRDRLSRELWEDINSLYHNVTRFNPEEEIAVGPHRFCNAIRFGSHSFHGVADDTLPHDEGWNFLQAGRALERAEMTARIVDVEYHKLVESPATGDTAGNHQWMAVLKSVAAYEFYRRQYHAYRARSAWRSCWCCTPSIRAQSASTSRPSNSLCAPSAERPRLLCGRSRAPYGKPARHPGVRSYRRHFRAGAAHFSGRRAEALPQYRREHRPHVLLLRGGGMNRCSLFHVTEFSYDGPVSESYNEVRLRPRQDETQSCLSFRLTTDPVARTSAYLDPYGNWVHRFNVLPEHRHLRVEADSVVLVQEPRPLPDDGLALHDLAQRAEELDEFYDLLCATVYVPHLAAVRELAGDAERDSGGSVAGFARAAAALVHDGFRYEKGATHVQSSIEDALQRAPASARILRICCWRCCACAACRRVTYRATCYRNPLPSRVPAPRK